MLDVICFLLSIHGAADHQKWLRAFVCLIFDFRTCTITRSPLSRDCCGGWSDNTAPASRCGRECAEPHLRPDLPQDLWIDLGCLLHAHIARRVGAEVAVVVCGGGVCVCVCGWSCDLILAPCVTCDMEKMGQSTGARRQGSGVPSAAIQLVVGVVIGTVAMHVAQHGVPIGGVAVNAVTTTIDKFLKLGEFVVGLDAPNNPTPHPHPRPTAPRTADRQLFQ
jgi:hypothetical protein